MPDDEKAPPTLNDVADELEAQWYGSPRPSRYVKPPKSDEDAADDDVDRGLR